MHFIYFGLFHCQPHSAFSSPQCWQQAKTKMSTIRKGGAPPNKQRTLKRRKFCENRKLIDFKNT